MIKQFTESHPTTDKGRLTSKFLAQMMLKCSQDISDEQITYLQQFKAKPIELDFTPNEALINIDWKALEFKGDQEDASAKRAVDMSPEESLMS